MGKLLTYISLFLLLITVAFAQQPQKPAQVQPTQDGKLHKEQYKFDGAWLPDHDPAEIGPANFRTLQNMRYGPNHPVGVSGYSKINTTAISTYTNIRSGHQLRSNRAQKTYVLVNAENDSGNAKVYQNQTSIPDQGDFEATELHTAATGAGLGRFSDAPQGSVAYCNEKESYIWGGEEIRVAGVFTVKEVEGAELIAVQADRDFSGATSWADVDLASYDESGDLSITADTAGQSCGLASQYAPMTTGSHGYQIRVTVSNIVDSWYLKDAAGNEIYELDSNAGYTFIYYPSGETVPTSGGFTLEAVTSSSSGDFDDFELKKISYEDPLNYTEAANNLLETTGNVVPINGDHLYWYVFTTRPTQAFKFYIGTANTSASTMVCARWRGTGWDMVENPSDGTNTGSISLAQDGIYSFDSTVSTAVPFHYEGLYLYAYRFRVTAASSTTTIANITADAPWQTIKDVWDGVLRQPIQFQVESAGEFENYTNEVNYQSDTNIPIGGILDGLLSTDNIVIMFDERMSGIRFEMLAGLVNTNASDLEVEYHSGIDWVSVGGSTDDGTDNDGATAGKTGLIFWSPPDVADEYPVTLHGKTGYAYRLTFSAALSGTKGVPIAEEPELLVDVVTGIPAQKVVKAFKFPSFYKNRLLLCSYTEGNEGNRVDFSSSNAPDVFNGLDSSMDGLQSLYFGNTDPLTCGTQLYNRYGSNVFATWVAFKKNSMFVLTGDTPEDFKIFPVSGTIGCPAPLTLATAEVGFEAVQGVQRNIAFWLSNSGPYMFDGSVSFPIQGVDKYFDPAESVCINHEYIQNARGRYNKTFREYNLLIPSGSGQETNNVWLVYDLMQKKWYEKSTGIAGVPQAAFTVTDTEGNQYVYAGVDTGYAMRLENGTSWDGSGITYKLVTGDFWPGKNVWDKTIIRQLKLVAKRIDEAHTVEIRYYNDTSDQDGVETAWVDTSDTVFADTDDCVWASATLINMELSLGTGLYRLVRETTATNLLGWTHGFSFQVTTTETEKAFEPIGWAIQYFYARDDL